MHYVLYLGSALVVLKFSNIPGIFLPIMNKSRQTFSSFISLFINDILIIWFIIEINNFIFLFYLTLLIKNKKIIFLYFFTQAIASFLILIPLIFNYTLIQNFYIINIIIIIGLLLKLGLPPFHFWFPIISIYIDWYIITILFSIQKIYAKFSLINEN